ncbi:MAG: hypothetical protein ABL996_04145, partial [Micropepsaceae bacterium]
MAKAEPWWRGQKRLNHQGHQDHQEGNEEERGFTRSREKKKKRREKSGMALRAEEFRPARSATNTPIRRQSFA